MTIVVLSLLLLIPGGMIKNLIRERQDRSQDTIEKINDKWSDSQTLCAPIVVIPFTTTKFDKDKKTYVEEHFLNVTPKNLNIEVTLEPEEKHYGIFKSILYKSKIHFEGNFSELKDLKIDNSELHFEKAKFIIGVTDLRGVSKNPICTINNTPLEATVGIFDLLSVSNNNDSDYPERLESLYFSTQGKTMMIELADLSFSDSLYFDCKMELNGSNSISFIPVGQSTEVKVEGQWESPSFIGGFSPNSEIENNAFKASWNILSFNREIPKIGLITQFQIWMKVHSALILLKR